MSQQGWGGQGPTPEDGSQQGWGQQNQQGPPNQQGQQPWQSPPQGGQPSPGAQQHAGGQGWQASPAPAPSWQQPSANQAPYGGSPAYGAPPPPSPPRKKWPLILVAAGCVLALVLAIGIVAIAALVNRGGGSDPTAAPTSTAPSSDAPTSEDPSSDAPTPSGEAEGSDFQVITPYDEPLQSADELWAIMADNPMTTGTFPTIGSCDLPGTPEDPSDEQLQATLEAANGCLGSVWSTASSDRDLPWSDRAITVYHHPDVPTSAVCDPESFSADNPRVCNLDNTIYWPAGYGIGPQVASSGLAKDEKGVSTAYLWDLSYSYVNVGWWNSSVGIYYTNLNKKLEDDPARKDEAARRYSSQNICMASLVSMRMPSNAQPTQEIRDQLVKTETWTDGPNITAATQAHWIQKGFESDGDLSACNAWDAPADEVA